LFALVPQLSQLFHFRGTHESVNVVAATPAPLSVCLAGSGLRAWPLINSRPSDRVAPNLGRP
jgi:hypothetical protein